MSDEECILDKVMSKVNPNIKLVHLKFDGYTCNNNAKCRYLLNHSNQIAGCLFDNCSARINGDADYTKEIIAEGFISHLQNLTVVFDNGISDLTPYSNIWHVDLQHFTSKYDISPLRNVSSLALGSLPSLTSLAGLEGGSINQLKIAYCGGIQDFTMLGRVVREKLSIFDCQLTTLEGIGNIPKLEIEWFEGVYSITHIENTMESLSISSVAGIYISEIEGDLSNLKYLNFDDVIFSSYARDQLANLLLTENKLFGLELHSKDLSSIVDILSNNDRTKGLRTLNVTSAKNVTLIPPFGNLHSLCLRNLDNLLDVSSLANIHTLYIISCDRLTDVSQLGEVRKLCLAGCNSIEDVSALGSVHDLDLSFCKSIRDF
jgi:hypothetical protein